MRLDLDEYRRQMIECAGGKVSDFYDAKTKTWKILKEREVCDSHLVMNAYDLCFVEHLIQAAYKAGLDDAIDEENKLTKMACETAYKTGFLEGVNKTTKALRGEADD